jgi:ferredoxin-type protein NapH
MLTTRQADLTLLLSLLIPFLAALVFGRVFCGWICPQNTISELVDRLASRLGIRRRFTVAPSPIPRFVVLAVILIVTLLAGFPLVSLLSAPGIISVQVAKFIYEGTVGLELGLIGLIIITELLFARRLWCNAICPVGSFLALLRTRRTLKVSFSESEREGRTCGRCYECAAACRLGLNPVTGPLARQCHNCGDCVDTCASLQGDRKPLSFTF